MNRHPLTMAAAVVAAVVAITVTAMVAHVRAAAKAHGWFRVAGRWFTGVPLHHGRHHYTNAGWRTRPEDVKVLHRSGRASKWQHQSLRLRTSVRAGGTIGVPAALIGLLVARTATVAALAAICATGVAWVAWRHGVPTLARLRHSGRRVAPIAEALASLTATGTKAVQRGVTWNPDYANTRPGALVATWTLPAGFKATPKERAAVEHLWQSRVGFEMVPAWLTSAERPSLELHRAHELPDLVLLRDNLAELDALPASKTGVGRDGQNELICWDWATENPHGLIVAGSRHGKSELNRSIVSQVVRKGGDVTGIDVKRVSFDGMQGLPGFTLRDDPRDIGAMWAAIKAFRDDMDWRIEETKRDPTIEWSRSVLIIEEVNQFSEMTDDWWEELPEDDQSARGTVYYKPKRAKRTPKVWRHIKAVCWEGAFVGKHVIIDGQDGNAACLKGVRNVLGLRLMGGFQPNQWKACVGTTPIPSAPKQRGRFCLVSGADQTWVQAVLGDKDPVESAAIWREYARAGRRLDGTVTAVTAHDANRPGQPEHAVTGGSVTGAVTGPDLVSLEEAEADGVITCRAESARIALWRDRQAGRPSPQAHVQGRTSKHLFDRAELRDWDTRRNATTIINGE